MPTIELSSDFLQGGSNGAGYRVFFPVNTDGVTTASATASGLLQGALTTNYPMTTFHLMKGAIPTDFSISSYTTRSADVLCTWQNVYNGMDVSNSASTTYNPVVLTSVYRAATQSGTATWFWWLSRAGISANTPGTTIYHQIYGTVGTTGSGADLELPSVTIVSGNNYRFINLRAGLSGPTFTY